MDTVLAPERIIPDETERGILAYHLKRYEFALERCADRDVLDIACGVGYGSELLATEARSVHAGDISAETVDYARIRYGSSGVRFDVLDAVRLALPDTSFDVVVSFETIEHLEHPELALAEFARVLRPGGTLVVSTPHVARTDPSPENQHHRVELSRTDLEALLRKSFVDIEIFGQRRLQTSAHRLAQRLDVLGLRRRVAFLRRGARLLGTAAMAEMTADDIVISADDIDRATEIVAVCRRR